MYLSAINFFYIFTYILNIHIIVNTLSRIYLGKIFEYTFKPLQFCLSKNCQMIKHKKHIQKNTKLKI